MEIEISWSSFIKGGLVAAFTYVALPFLMALRDKGVWLLINKWYMNEELNKKIIMYAMAKNWLDGPNNLSYRINNGENGKECYLGGKAVTQEELKAFMDYEHTKIDVVNDNEKYIKAKERGVKYLLHHYKLKEDENPVTVQLNRNIKAYSKLEEN